MRHRLRGFANWARTAISLLRERRGDRLIAEINNGGEMVENTLRMVDASVPYRSVWASRPRLILQRA